MGKLNKNERGFSAVEGFIILVMLALIGLAGWYVWHRNKSSNANITPSNSSNAIVSSANQWTGGGGNYNWSDAKNWSKGTPKDGQDIEIDMAKVKQPSDGSQLAFKNDLNITIGKLTFKGSIPSGIFDIRGNPLKIAGGIVDSVAQTDPNSAIVQAGIDTDVIFTKDQTVSISSKNGDFSFGHAGDKTVDIGDHHITFVTTNKATIGINSPIKGTGKLTFPASSTSTTFRYPSPQFSGDTEIAGGIVDMDKPLALGTGRITVSDGAALGVSSAGTTSFTINNPLTLSGNGFKWTDHSNSGLTSGAVYSCLTQAEEGCGGGTNVTITGQIILLSNTQLGTSPADPSAPAPTSTTTTYHISKPVQGGYSLTAVPNSFVRILQ